LKRLPATEACNEFLKFETKYSPMFHARMHCAGIVHGVGKRANMKEYHAVILKLDDIMPHARQ
jgi:hypothetical protein